MNDPNAQGTPPEPRHDDPRSGGRPALATVIGVVVMLLALVGQQGGPPPQAEGRAGMLGYVAGSALFGLLVWGVCYAITIRRAHRAWKIASAAVLILLGAFSGLVSLGRRGVALEEEGKAITEQMKTIAKDPSAARFDAGPDAGPLTRLSAATFAPIIADNRRITEAQEAAGVNQILSGEGLTHQSPVLDRCDRLAALVPMSQAHRDRFPAYLEAARKQGAALVAERKLTAGEVDGFISGFLKSRDAFIRQKTLAIGIAESAEEMCRTLARRNWMRGPDGGLAFTDEADLAAVQRIGASADPMVVEYNRMREGGIADLEKVSTR